GSEKKGVEYSRDDLFANAQCLMTPTDKTLPVTKEKIKHMWTKIGAHVKIISPEVHDEALSFVSHLPHLSAFGLINSIPDQFMEFASQGLKDATRIASSSPEMWSDICMANAKNIVVSLDQYVKILSDIRNAIAAKDQETLLTSFTNANTKRNGILPDAVDNNN
ncbi:MAG: prephenate dehydrogenase/arogenate dehydrogenase family protein, partial [Candidatus Omnitrophica bacterium]|nr:prephenate dehydrogenase/arogenate dehydrogenase family protein [Candidatus Omnitrophota bacterium]